MPRVPVLSLFSASAPRQEQSRVERHLASVGLPTRLQDVPGGFGDVEALLDAMAQDKKVQAGALTFILARGIGEASSRRACEVEKVRAFLDKLKSVPVSTMMDISACANSGRQV